VHVIAAPYTSRASRRENARTSHGRRAVWIVHRRATMRRLRFLFFVAVLCGCAKPADAPEQTGADPTGNPTGRAKLSIHNASSRPIYVAEECCHPAALKLEAGAMWTYGSHFCDAPGYHNDPNARVVRIEPGESRVQDWSGVLYGVGTDRYGECHQARYADPGPYEGTVCAFDTEPPSPRSEVARRCKEIVVTLPASGAATTEVRFEEP